MDRSLPSLLRIWIRVIGEAAWGSVALTWKLANCARREMDDSGARQASSAWEGLPPTECSADVLASLPGDSGANYGCSSPSPILSCVSTRADNMVARMVLQLL